MDKGPVIFITGAPGVGKSTVGRALADRFERAFFLDLDAFRANVVKGLAQPSAGWSEETTLQFQLAHRAAGRIADLYSRAGFAVVVAHCSNRVSVSESVEECPHARVVCLRADLEVNRLRNNARTHKSFDPRDIEFFVFELAVTLPDEFENSGYAVIDTTTQSVEETLDALCGVLAIPCSEPT